MKFAGARVVHNQNNEEIEMAAPDKIYLDFERIILH